jgi:hypothetical protein
LSRNRWILVVPGRIETQHSTINDATAAGERFLLGHPAECRVVVYEIGEDGTEGKTRLIFHWPDECFHYLEAGSTGPEIGNLITKACDRSIPPGEEE